MTYYEDVKQYYPNAMVFELYTIKRKKRIHEVWSPLKYLGQGKSKKAAWKSASRNL